MKYWEQYQSKWGFGDGDATPPDAVQVRAVYIHVFNTLAQQAGTGQRLLPYDRPGMHNPWLVFAVPAATLPAIAGTDPRTFALGPFQGEWEQSAGDIREEPLSVESASLLDFMNDACIDDFVSPRNQIRWSDMNTWLERGRTRQACLRQLQADREAA